MNRAIVAFPLVLFIFLLVMAAGCHAAMLDKPSYELSLAEHQEQELEFRDIAGALGRRRLAPFQQCSTCRCCKSPSDPNSCSNVPCCYTIKCDLPNKPPGTCALVPVACNCQSCS